MDVVLGFYLTLLLRIVVTEENDTGLCWTLENDKWVGGCCFNFYPKNGKCTECEIGTVSFDGVICLPCDENMYGRKCFSRCRCSAKQRCDSRLGCVDDSVLTTTDVTASTDSETRSTITEDNIPAGLQATNFFYMMAGAFLVVMCIACVSFIKCMHQRHFHVHTQQQQCALQSLPAEIARAHERLPLPPTTRSSQHIYHTIYDNVVSNIPEMNTDNKNINLANSFTRSEPTQSNIRVSDDSINGAPSNEFNERDYLNAYNPLTEKSRKDSVVHEYDDCRTFCSQTSLTDKNKRDIEIHEYVAIRNPFQPSKKQIIDKQKRRSLSMHICTNCACHEVVYQNTQVPEKRKYPSF